MAGKVVFSGTGTRGDLIPLLALAAELQRRGHDCHVLCNDPSGALARRFGVPFTPGTGRVSRKVREYDALAVAADLLEQRVLTAGARVRTGSSPAHSLPPGASRSAA